MNRLSRLKRERDGLAVARGSEKRRERIGALVFIGSPEVKLEAWRLRGRVTLSTRNHGRRPVSRGEETQKNSVGGEKVDSCHLFTSRPLRYVSPDTIAQCWCLLMEGCGGQEFGLARSTEPSLHES
ncbi:hypothetical protein E2C01_007331 [Portunus trituberculatus]|uniref:Uncharacterized protein n=1 Tax=Portunus trituberculatus TaxID=210409 RepID=A0A5B7D415_PORTR|nr:hypothetical protein [Portunus trituberculatus]